METDIQGEIRLHVNRLPFARVARVNSGVFCDDYGARRIRAVPKGTPDLCGVVKVGSFQSFFAIEVKRGNAKPSPDQKAWHRFARKWGIHVIIATSVQEAIGETKRLHARLALELGMRIAE
jgi:hypothetical protein